MPKNETAGHGPANYEEFGGYEAWAAVERAAVAVDPVRILDGEGAPFLKISAFAAADRGSREPHTFVALRDSHSGRLALQINFDAGRRKGLIEGEVERYRIEMLRLLGSFGVAPLKFDESDADCYWARTTDPARDVVGLCREIVARIRPIERMYGQVTVRDGGSRDPFIVVPGRE